jgi:hypothetical protein
MATATVRGVAAVAKASGPVAAKASANYTQPVLPPDVTQFYLPANAAGKQPGQELEYQAWVLGIIEVAFQVDKRTGAEHRVTMRKLSKAPEVGHPIEWGRAYSIDFDPEAKPQAQARWGTVPESIDTGKKLKALEKVFADHIYSTEKMTLFENRELELTSAVGETLQAFRARCKKAAESAKTQALEMEKIKFTPKLEAAKQSTSKGAADRVARLEADYQAKQDEIAELYRRISEEATEVQIKPRKVDIRVTHFGLAWAPFWVAK